MRRCLYCEAEISDSALKCQHCGEWIKPKETAAPTDAPPVVAPPKTIQPPVAISSAPKVSRRNLQLIAGGALMAVLLITWSYQVTQYRSLLAQADQSIAQARSDYTLFNQLIRKDGNITPDLSLEVARSALRSASRSLNAYNDAAIALEQAEKVFAIFRFGKPSTSRADVLALRNQLLGEKRQISRAIARRLLQETLDEAKGSKTDSNLRQLALISSLLKPTFGLVRTALGPLHAAIMELKDFSVAGVSAWDALEKIFPPATEVGSWVEKLYGAADDTADSAKKIRDGLDAVEKSRKELLKKRDWTSLIVYNAAWRQASADFSVVSERLKSVIEPQEKLRKHLNEFRVTLENIETDWLRQAVEKVFVLALKSSSAALGEIIEKFRSYQNSLDAIGKTTSSLQRDELIQLIADDAKDLILPEK